MGGRPLAVHEYKIRFLLILGAPGVEKTNPVIPICSVIFLEQAENSLD